MFTHSETASYCIQEQAGFKMKLLDIGGGFPGFSNSNGLFKEVWLMNFLPDTFKMSRTDGWHHQLITC